jgi:hypothetical protein
VTTCTPIRPFRCWQYRKDSTEPVPEWVQTRPTMLIDGEWHVEVSEDVIEWYTPAEFQERFIVEEGK